MSNFFARLLGRAGAAGLRSLAAALAAGALAACTTTAVLEPAPAPLPAEKYAAIVVDARSGRVLSDHQADAMRYPASLTKMMTLYLLFEAIDAGRVRLDTPMPVSAHAAARPPSRIGLRAGTSIDARSAILALTVRSANDVAAVVGEFLGGSEAEFAAQMTLKARQLGMRSTVFRNASGLPDDAQRTTARDMAILALALRRHFPHHYPYFSVREFTYDGRVFRGRDSLIGRVPGVDGLKTGYIRASGFNLATSAGQGGRRIVAVVMGADTARSRDEHMEELVRTYLPRASAEGSGR